MLTLSVQNKIVYPLSQTLHKISASCPNSLFPQISVFQEIPPLLCKVIIYELNPLLSVTIFNVISCSLISPICSLLPKLLSPVLSDFKDNFSNSLPFLSTLSMQGFLTFLESLGGRLVYEPDEIECKLLCLWAFLWGEVLCFHQTERL